MKEDMFPLVINAEQSLVDTMELMAYLKQRNYVLDKVKKLFLVKGMEIMTMLQIAEFYDVMFNDVSQCYQRNQDEIYYDGAIISEPNNIDEYEELQDDTTELGQSIKHEDYENAMTFINHSKLIFSNRAVLRFGMHLRESEVAKEVRTQLLNIFK